MASLLLPRSPVAAKRTTRRRRSFVISSTGNGKPEGRQSQHRKTVRCDGYAPNTFPVPRRLNQGGSLDATSVRAFQSLVEERVAALVLGGGRGENLFPLTKSRAEAAVSLGGAYRMVDIPISNCINSGLKRIYVLTQYNSTSLNRHIARTYNQNPGLGSSVLVEVLAAARTPTENNWFRGTADAVRRYDWILKDIRSRNVEHVIILSGDHLYRMDYLAFLEEHMSKDADFTIACTPCSRQAAADYGLMKIRDGKVIQFAEKPTGVALEAMRTSSLDIGDDFSEDKPFLASMGVYVFKKDILLDLLDKRRDFDDFGKEVIPFAYQNGYSVHANLFRGYWEDIGNMRSFYEANLGFNRHPQKFEFFLPGWPVYTCPHRGPPTTMSNCKIKNATISDGCWLQGCKIENSVIGLGSFVGARSIITDSVLMGASKVESEERRKMKREKGEIPLGVGQDCVVRNTIIDKDARIGDGCKLVNAGKVEEGSRPEIGCYIRDGLIVIEKGAEVPDWTVI
ncbi:hypothetical protein BSKO_07330 [Bryopsis sp. KO-2023]|nr:hypothetical protein BSKO_07330 [Bryopsis sp. KO-2023]